MRWTLLTLVLALSACGRDDKSAPKTPDSTASVTTPRGPDHLVLRIAKTGGEARVYSYPKLDTVVWRASAAPSPERVLAFDEEAGIISYVDTKGAPARLDFRQGVAGNVTKTKLASLASWDGSNIYGIASDGFVERYGPSGPFRWRPRLPARAVFPQPDATLLILAQHGDSSVIWRLRPPASKIADSVVLSRVNRTLRTQVADRLYLGSGRELTGVRTRTMQRATSIRFDDEIEVLEATPSGDRLFVVTKSGTTVEIVDRFREAIGGSIDIARHAADLRVDPLGRYLLARPEGSDSVLVIALGTNRVIGAVASAWREDLPFVAPDGGIALADGDDVALVDGETLRETSRVKGGAADFWFAFRWTGFRPRDARLDKPVQFGNPDSGAASPADGGRARPESSTVVPIVPAPKDTAPRHPAGFTVSFAALLAQDKARDLAAQIKVGNDAARVVPSVRDGSTIYRVVLGPYPTREEAERVGRESKQQFWVYEGGP
ncbi:MAG: SPOR domain-containing protein [Gemmatimonadota bacterium]